MSSKKTAIAQNKDFIERFTEVCGTNQPSNAARLLNISYQAAKNYFQGRLPDPNVLRTISERTPYSIHWLLTGRGEKFAEHNDEKKDTNILTDALRTIIREECTQIISEFLNVQKQSETTIPQPRIVVLTPDKIKEEKVLEDSDASSIKRS